MMIVLHREWFLLEVEVEIEIKVVVGEYLIYPLGVDDTRLGMRRRMKKLMFHHLSLFLYNL